ncbi:MAG: hypothetical protein K2X48_08805 [Chitinophagaceae bacterium]|nr:hypothetical protein [Chitinophagaceae bacterium]
MQAIKLTDTYKSFYRLIIEDSKIEIEDVTRLIGHISSANRVLQEFGLFLQKDGNYINYLPGSYNYSGNFYPHPIKLFGNLVLHSLREKDFWGQSSLGISKEEHMERNNPKGFEISLQTTIDYEITSFKVYANNEFGVFNAVKTLQHLKLYFKEGFGITELNQDFGATYTVALMNRHTRNCYKRILNFVEALKFMEWSEVSSRVGKDNVIESGIIIISDSKNNYFHYLMDKFTEFKKSGDNKFEGKAEREYGYIKSSPYQEHEMKELDTENYRNEIVSALVKNYNADKEILYHFYKS